MLPRHRKLLQTRRTHERDVDHTDTHRSERHPHANFLIAFRAVERRRRTIAAIRVVEFDATRAICAHVDAAKTRVARLNAVRTEFADESGERNLATANVKRAHLAAVAGGASARSRA